MRSEIHCDRGKGDGQRGSSTSGVQVRLPIRGQRGPPGAPGVKGEKRAKEKRSRRKKITKNKQKTTTVAARHDEDRRESRARKATAEKKGEKYICEVHVTNKRLTIKTVRWQAIPEKALARQCWPPLTHKHNRLACIIRQKQMRKTKQR